MNFIMCFIIGAIFSIGLTISGMVNPNKVIGFLDFFGKWDPALAFVMGGGVITNIILFKFILKRKNPLFDTKFFLPENNQIDKKLIIGSALFGIGWGVGGVCPGPGLANLFLFEPQMIVFVLSMITGMFIFKRTLGK